MADLLQLCDKEGHVTGSAEFMKIHTEGLLHRAFSIYVFRNDGKELLIQKRSEKKLLFRHIWANTCCSHPRDGESTENAAARRLPEECGFSTPLEAVESFVYRAEDPEGRGIEHEHVTIFRGAYDATLEPAPNPHEIEEMKWMNVAQLMEDMKKYPDIYAPWFHKGLHHLLHAKRD